jgi:hypothetical protein
VKQLVAASLVLGSLAVSAPAADSKTSLRASVGMASPAAGDLDDVFGSGLHLSVAVGRDLGSHLVLLGEIEYCRLALDQDAFQSSIQFGTPEQRQLFERLGGRVTIEGGDTGFLGGSVALKGAILGNARSFTPYVIAGGGASRRQSDAYTLTLTLLGITERETIESSSETVPAISFGGGLDLKVGRAIGLFVEGRYQIAFTEDETAKYTTLRAGLSFRP